MMKMNAKTFWAIIISFAMIIGSVAGVDVATAASKKVTVKPSKTKLSLKKGKKYTLKIKTKNVKKITKKTFKSSKKSVATVSKKGKITAKKAGKTTITCKVTYIAKGSKKKKTKTLSCKVTVKDSAKKTTATKKPAVRPTVVPTEEPIKVLWNDTSNIGDEREVSIVGGTEKTMKVKDNGTMRKELSSQDLIATEMGLGINLGNTMEASKAVGEVDNFTEATDFEQAWGAPITTAKYIDSIHSYGFNTLRIPVAWTSMVSKDGNYTINDKMLGRVEEIVNYALNNGMYVVINDHYDYGWWGAFGSAKEEVRKGAWKRYEAYWTQICERFKGYSDHLIFESGNEELTDKHGIPNGGLNGAINEDGYNVGEENGGVAGILTEDEAYEMANKINQKFVDIVRASGGNNEYRHLLIAGNGTDIVRTVNSRFVMPTDPIEENKNSKLMVSVHYYNPWSFCGDSQSGAKYTESDRKHTVEQFEKLTKFTDAGYGVIVGEFGVCNPLQDQVCEWLEDTITIAKKAGSVPCLWDTPGTYFDRENCIMQFKDVAEMYNRLTGAKGDTNIEKSTGLVKADVNYYTSVPTDAKIVFEWKGAWKKNKGDNMTLDGGTATAEDPAQFIRTDSVTDKSQLLFNPWGYQCFMKLDWTKLKNPVVKFEFADDNADAVGELQFATSKIKMKDNGKFSDTTSKDLVAIPYETWTGKYISVPAAILKTMQTDELKNYLYITFGNNPMVTGITVYEMD